MIYLPKENKCFVMIPKNASSSARDLFKNNQDAVRVKVDDLDHINVQTVIDHGLLTTDVKFYGVIRDPFERQLSLYLYRQRQQRYDTELSIEDFPPENLQGVSKITLGKCSFKAHL
jgi:hypothetical protein